MTREEIEFIRNAVEETCAIGFEELDFTDYIYACDELTEEQKEWASANLGVHIEVDVIG